MKLPPLYHWSPIDRRPTILAVGLRPGQTVTTGLDYIRLGFTASGAWVLSGITGATINTPSTWDLWQVHLAETDDMIVQSGPGTWLHEVRVHNPIPAGRLWLVGTREHRPDTSKMGVAS